VEHRRTQAQFRVAWITAREDSSEKQIGAERLEPGKQVCVSYFLSNRMNTKKKNDRD